MTDFESIYSSLVSRVSASLATQKLAVPAFEPAAVASYSVFEIPRTRLTDAPTDDEFALAAYFKVLDRAPSDVEVAAIVGRLTAGASRDELLDELVGGREAADRGVRIDWV